MKKEKHEDEEREARPDEINPETGPGRGPSSVLQHTLQPPLLPSIVDPFLGASFFIPSLFCHPTHVSHC